VARQRARGLDARWAAQIPKFLDSVPFPPSSPVLLHTEVMREHLLATSGPAGGWSLSGLYDFEPAMMGDAKVRPRATLGRVPNVGHRPRSLIRSFGDKCLSIAANHPVRKVHLG
jgi:hypothetical protein